ncbi:MAG: transketolase [Polyangia bacterium]
MFEPAKASDPDLAKKAVDTIKFLAIDAVEKANSGHPGLPMGAADYAFVLWSRFLKFDPKDPHWADRDRFVLSPGHGSALLYALLHLAGYDLSMDELKSFRQWGSKTPGHPESHLTPGVEVTTGPLGQGCANAVGMALAGKIQAERFPGLFDHHVWAIVSDGDMMEGISHEAASIAGHLKLSNLTFLYDSNNITLDGKLDDAMDEDVAARFKAYGWKVRSINGHDHDAIADALAEARAESEAPRLIVCQTHIGNGAPNKHDTHKVHGEPLGKEETEATKKIAGWPLDKPFFVPDEVAALWKRRAGELGKVHADWKKLESSWLDSNKDKAATYLAIADKTVPANLMEELVKAAPAKTDATRSLAGAIEQRLAALVPSFIGGDADLGGSTKTPIKDSTKIEAGSFAGRNICFGIREHAMGAMANGMAAYGGFIPFTATFLTFSDYMRPAIRLAALSDLQVIHVFTHDSIFLGEDGPTHQSVEHTAALRMIPNVDVWRPANAIECAVAWGMAVERKDGPSEIILSRQKVDEPAHPVDANAARHGAYVSLAEQGGKADLVIMATGSEVGPAVQAAQLLIKDGLKVRVVSMPCVEVFERQDKAYQASVLPDGIKRVSVEAGRTEAWYRFVGLDGLAIGIDRFGASAPASVLAEKYGLTGAKIAEQIRAWRK